MWFTNTRAQLYPVVVDISVVVAEWVSSYMEDTVHYETLLTSESLAGVRPKGAVFFMFLQ